MGNFLFAGLSLLIILCYSRGYSQDTINFKMDPEKVDCHNIPESFKNLKEGEEILSNAIFRRSLRFHTTKQTGVMAGQYYSCDNKSGFLVLLFNKKKLIYGEFTSKAWDGLVNTNDPDGYYINKIKGKYPLVAEEI